MNCDFGGANPSRTAWKGWNCSAKLLMPMTPLPRDFQDFLRLLNANAIRYLVIGGYAVAYHGYVRYTGDLVFLSNCHSIMPPSLFPHCANSVSIFRNSSPRCSSRKAESSGSDTSQCAWKFSMKLTAT